MQWSWSGLNRAEWASARKSLYKSLNLLLHSAFDERGHRLFLLSMLVVVNTHAHTVVLILTPLVVHWSLFASCCGQFAGDQWCLCRCVQCTDLQDKRDYQRLEVFSSYCPVTVETRGHSVTFDVSQRCCVDGSQGEFLESSWRKSKINMMVWIHPITIESLHTKTSETVLNCWR